MKEYKNIQVQKSRNGKGVFATKNFPPDTKIVHITGRFVECNKEDDMDEEARANTYRFDDNLFVDPENGIGKFFNHSCNPNAKIIKKDEFLYMVSIGDIPAGDEIVFDYSTILASDDSWEMKCNCGEKNCRGIVKKFIQLPKKIRLKYIQRGLVPKYILEI